jgi:uncharacterized protein
MDFKLASEYIIQRLHRELKPELHYHCLEHTLDVLEATRRLADAEGVESHARTLLETASLYHDAGMIVQYKDHESASVALVKEVLPQFGYSKSDIDEISRLIMVTKLPQRPYDHLEQIICDADLDYLGRADFFLHSFKLRLEWQATGIRNTTLPEWFEFQIKFLTEHRYFTKSANLLRNKKKLKHLEEIKQIVNRKS